MTPEGRGGVATTTITPYRSTVPGGTAGFAQLLRAEWTKFRTVRGWLVGTVVAVLLLVLIGILASAGSQRSTAGPGGAADLAARTPPTGPDGAAVIDRFQFVHQPLAGDGTVTARVTSLTPTAVELPAPGAPGQGGPEPGGPGPAEPDTAVIQPWAKAGIIIKENTKQGSRYASIMITGSHGVRMQYDFTGDTAGPAGMVSEAAPQWLRLSRTGETLTGYSSTDGNTWTTVGTVHIGQLPSTVQAGLFVASPAAQAFEQNFGGVSSNGQGTAATATFDGVALQGTYPDRAWQSLDVGSDPQTEGLGRVTESGGTFTVTGTGNIAPAVDGAPGTIERTLIGAFAALTVLVILGVLFVTTEYRRGLNRTSFAASPRRGRILAAKAIVMGAVTFVVGLVAAAAAIPLCEQIMRANGNVIHPVAMLTEVRVVVGTAALLAVAAVLAVAIGAILRRSAGAVAAVIVLTVLPYILSVAAVLPAGAAQWVLRLTPAAAFAIQQSVAAYPQVDQAYTPAFGFYPLDPWVGFAVLCGWAAVALGLATYLLRRRDA